MTIAVIGAGASGMMAALTAAEQPENKILLFERQARVGRKLAVTGNGRCNRRTPAPRLKTTTARSRTLPRRRSRPSRRRRRCAGSPRTGS